MESRKGAYVIGKGEPPCDGYIVDGMFYGTLYEAQQYGPPGAAKRAKKLAPPIQYGHMAIAYTEKPPPPLLSDDERKQRHRARQAVANAVCKGLLPRQATQSCTDCGASGPLAFVQYDHYMGYDDACFLAVEPGCRACHGRRSAAETAVRRSDADARR